MTATLQETPSANRIHIGFYGKRNSGKSSLFNAFAGQQVSIVSEEAISMAAGALLKFIF